MEKPLYSEIKNALNCISQINQQKTLGISIESLDIAASKLMIARDPESYGIPENIFNYLIEDRLITLDKDKKITISYAWKLFLEKYRIIEYFMSDHPFASAAIIASIGGIISWFISLLPKIIH